MTVVPFPSFSVSGSTPAERRAALAAMDDAAIAQWLLAGADAARQHILVHGTAVAELAGVPRVEAIASPFGYRALVQATAVGGANVQLEWRAPLEWPDSSIAPDNVQDELHQVWDAGVLHVGKYQSFLQDEPFATYNPNHMAKWSPHELMHRVAGFWWREAADPFELYIAARLNELVPVTLWYGVDEALRGDASGFDRAASAKRPWITDADVRWLEADGPDLDALLNRSVPHVRACLAHFEREWAAIDQELRTGRCVAIPDERLDASSDAMAYVVGHRQRLQDRAIARMIPRLWRRGRDWWDDLPAYRDHIESVFDALLFAPLQWDAALARSRRDRRLLIDVVQRAAQRGWPVFRGLVAALDPLGADLERAWHGEGTGLVERWWPTLAQKLPGDERDRILALGAPWYAPSMGAFVIEDGLHSLAPQTWSRLQHAGVAPSVIGSLLEQSTAAGRHALIVRFRRAVDQHGEPGAQALLALEACIAHQQTPDDRIEQLCLPSEDLPDDLDGIGVIPSSAFVWLDADLDVQALHADPLAQPQPGAGGYLVGYFQGGVSILPGPPGVRVLWAFLQDQGAVLADDAVELLELQPGDESSVPFGDVDDEDDAPAQPADASVDTDVDDEEEGEFEGDDGYDENGLPVTGDAWLRELVQAGAVGLRRIPALAARRG